MRRPLAWDFAGPGPTSGEIPARTSTRFRAYSRRKALGVLAATVLAIDWCLSDCRYVGDVIDINNIGRRLDDAPLYRSVARRVRRGEGYYAAVASELLARDYPVESIFNWRTPVYAWIFGKPPGPSWGRWLLAACTILAVGAACAAVGPEGGRPLQLTIAGGMVASSGWLVDPSSAYYMEYWSGLFLLISACCLGLGKSVQGVLAAGAALALRELAFPYVAVMTALALWQRRWRLFLGMILVSAIFTAGFAVHWAQVLRHVEGPVSPQFSRWVDFGGLPFLLTTCRMNFLLAILPAWCTAVYLPMSVLGLLAWEGREASMVRWASATYLVLFMLAGKPFNFYWGWEVSPLLVVGFAWSPLALRDLVAATARWDAPRARGLAGATRFDSRG